MNAVRHGLTAQTLVLSNESQAKFDQMLASYIERFKPADEVEMNLIDEMVAARWRQQRVWMIQTATLDLEMARQEEEIEAKLLNVTEPMRLSMAFTTLANQEKTLALLMRYETSYSRMHDRALKALQRLKQPVVPTTSEKLQNDPKSVDQLLSTVPNLPQPGPSAPSVPEVAPDSVALDAPTAVTPGPAPVPGPVVEVMWGRLPACGPIAKRPSPPTP